jgi:hypothetical protein
MIYPSYHYNALTRSCSVTFPVHAFDNEITSDRPSNTRNTKWREPKSQSFSKHWSINSKEGHQSILKSISQTKRDDPSSKQFDEGKLALQTWMQWHVFDNRKTGKPGNHILIWRWSTIWRVLKRSNANVGNWRIFSPSSYIFDEQGMNWI